MSLLQPTIRRFPKTADTLADSNLPFSCVVTPMREPSSKDPKTQLLKKTGLSHHNYPLLTSIPKCMKCGAPHPTKETHFWPYPYSMSSSAAPSFLVCYLCGGKTTNDKLPPPSSIVDPHASSDRLLPQIYQIPLFSTPEVTYWSLPAHSCPPVCWFLLDGSCTHRSYWNTMSHVLLQIIDDIPPHVHVGILLAATVPSSASEEAATTISYVDLTSPVPHILQFVQYAGEEDDDEEIQQRKVTASTSGGAVVTTSSGGGLLDKLSLVPANSLHLPNIHAAIRSLVDYDPSQLATTQRAYTMSMPLGRSVETILDFMDRAQHPGAISPTSPLKLSNVAGGDGIDASSQNNNNALEDQLWYAGGKIMTFLASCPTDLRGDDWRPLTRKNLPRTTVGLGGFGGAVQKNSSPAMNGNGDGHYDGVTTSIDEETGGATAASLDAANGTLEILDTDMTPPSLLDYYRAPEHVEAYFQELGSQCAESALGVDIFVLVQPQEAHDFPGSDYRVGEYEDDGAELDVGLPFLRSLADRSGAPGPLIFPLHQGYSTPIAANPNIQRFQREVYARVPWGAYDGENNDEKKDETISLDNFATRGRHNVMGFGGELRMRLSPSFEVDKAPVDEVEEGPQLAPLYSSGGIMGPAAEEEESGNLWRFGTCDPFTSVTIDLDVKDAKVKDRLNVDGMGEISWKPVLQTCFAYTTIVNDPEQPGEYLTVRQMRIASARAHLTDSVETLYSSIDPEVIGSVLFHKLTLTLLRDGLSVAQTIGEDWLKSLLVCAYKSAETQEKIQRERAEHGLHQQVDSNGNGDNTTLTFYANERLLDREGELSAEEVLLAQGHELLKNLPLTVYSLLHCDAIRPSSSKTANISSGYYPTMDARCAAGAQMSSMNPPILAKCIAPRLQLWSCSEGLILDNLNLKMEAITVAVEEFGNDARTGKSREDLVFFLDAPDSIVVCDARYISDSLSRQKKKKKSIIGVDLQKAINAALCSYRTPPTVLVDLVEPAKQDASSGGQGYRRLLAALVEDMPGSNGARNFNQWGDHLAEEIHEELEKDD